MPLRVLGVAGSMRERAHSSRALEMVLEAAGRRGAETRLLELRRLELPMYRPRRRHEHAGLLEADEAVQWAEAFVLASPDYHGTMSGAMKNFLDYYWEEFSGKLFGYICASHEKGLTVMEHMRTAVRQCYGWSMPYGASVHGEQDFAPTGDVSNDRLARRLEMLGRDLVVYGTRIRDQFQQDLAGDDAATFAARYRS